MLWTSGKIFLKKEIYITMALLCIISACSDKNRDITSSIQNHMERSIAYQEQGQFRASIIEARNIISLDKSNTAGYERLANIYLALGNGKDTAALLEPLRENSDPEISLLLAKAYNKQGKFLSAKNSLDDYIKTGGSAAVIDYIIASATTNAGNKRVNKAIENLEILINKYPNDIDAYIALSAIYLKSKLYHQAERNIASTLLNFPTNPQALYLAGQIAHFNHELDSAEKLLTESLMNLQETDILTPLRLSVLDRLASVLTEQKRTSEALIYRRLLASASPEASKAKTKFTKALELLNSGEINAAEKLFEELYQTYPDNDINALYLGFINYQQGNLQGANTLFDRHLDTETAPVALVEQAAISNLKLNKTQQALAILEQALLVHKDNASLLRLYGLAALAQPKTEQAGLLALQKSIAIKPEQNTLRLTLASYYFKKDKLEQGLAQINQLLKRDAGNIQATALYAQTMLLHGQTDQASIAIKELLRLKPDDVKSLNLAAKYYRLIEKPDTSEKLSLKALKFDPDNIAALNNLASIAIVNNQQEEAIKHYKKIIHLRPELPFPYKGLVVALASTGKTNQPLSALNEYTSDTSPDNKKATANAVKAEYYLRDGDINKASEYISMASLPNIDTVYINRISSLIDYESAQQAYSNRDWDKARTLLIKLSNGIIDQQKISNFLIQLELESGQLQEAEQLILSLEKQHPEQISTLLARARLYDKQGEKNKGDKYLENVWKKNITPYLGEVIYQRLNSEPSRQLIFLHSWAQAEPDNYKPFSHLALNAQKNGKNIQAILYYEQALELNPNASALLNNLAWLYYEENNPLALDTAQRAYELSPERAAILDTYGWILVNKGRKDEGIEILELALKAANSSEQDEINSHLKSAREI